MGLDQVAVLLAPVARQQLAQAVADRLEGAGVVQLVEPFANLEPLLDLAGAQPEDVGEQEDLPLAIADGAGALTAAILIGHTAGNERFRSEASLGLQTGTAPIPCSSGQSNQHRLNRGGDRQLNHALHIIAVTRARRDPATKQYPARKEAEGKTSKGALHSLKRHLARRFHKPLSEPPADPDAMWGHEHAVP
jgi:transposase